MLINFLGFQVIWFGSILLGDSFLLVSAGLIAAHFFYNPSTRNTDAKLALVCLLCGLVIDNGLMFLGVMAFPDVSYSHLIVPTWLLSLWVAFGLTINHSLKAFRGKFWLAFVSGGIFGPLSYMAGERLGAVEMQMSPLETFAVFALIWAPLFSLMLKWSASLNQYSVNKVQHV